MSEPLLLCTDLDRTLLPNGPQAESPGARPRFARLAARPEVTLAYVTGRHRALVERAMADFLLPRPDHVVADVGTTIYRVDDSGWAQDEAWRRRLDDDWHGHDASVLRARLASIPDLRPQERERQGAFKLSFYVPLYRDAATLVDEVEKRLAGDGIAVHAVHSIDEPRHVGLLDVLPASAGKLQAIRFLAAELGFPIARVLFAGDSGNDLAVLASEVPAVLVANAAAEVAGRASTLARAQGNEAQLHRAGGNFLGMNGCYAAGILEGAAHFFPETRAWGDAP